MLSLAFRNIFRNRLRTALTLAAVACGVAAIIVSGGFVEDIFLRLREATIHSRLGHIQVHRAGFKELGRRDPARYLIQDPGEIVRRIASVPHVKEVLTRVEFSGLANNGRADLPIVGEGVEPDKEDRLGTATTYLSGRALSDKDPFGVVVGEGVAHALRLAPGSPLTLTVSTPGGALNALEFTVVGVFRTFSKDFDDRAVRIAQGAAQELLNTPSVHAVVLLLDHTESTAGVLAALQRNLDDKTYEITPWHELADFYAKTVALYRRQFGALQVIILVMLVLSVASTVNMIVHERTGEFGTLLALGTRRRAILRLVLVENALLGLLGAGLGVVLGAVAAVTLSAIGIEMPPPPGSTASYRATILLLPTIVAGAAVTGLIAAVAAAILPGRRASRLPVVEALRHNV